MEEEKEINSKIIEITMLIKEKYPKLHNNLHMNPDIVRSEKDPHIKLKILGDYYDLLKSQLRNHIREQENTDKAGE